MNKEKIQQLRQGGFFKKSDLIIYSLLLVAVLLLFWIFVFSASDKKITSVKFQVSDRLEEKIALEYDFAQDEFIHAKEYEELIEIENGDSEYFVTIKTKSKNGYNKVKIGKNGEVVIIDANCSAHKDCVSFPPITKEGGIIVCVPHSLSIIGGEGGMTDDPIIG